MSGLPKLTNVVEVLDETHVVLNSGRNDDVNQGERFVIFTNDREIKDTDGKSLGKLELVKGYAKVSHVQDTMCIVVSDLLAGGFKALPPNEFGFTSVTERTSYLLVKRGDFARKV